MRFSLKWLLAAAVYVAIAAAALSQQSGLYGDLLWGMTLLALLFATLLALFSRGRRRVVATGFVLGGAAFVMYAMFAPMYASAPARLLRAVGYDPAGISFRGPTVPDSTPPLPATPPSVDPFADDLFGPPPLRHPGIVVSFDQFVRAANAIGVAVMGMLGALMGVFAARVVSETEAERTSDMRRD